MTKSNPRLPRDVLDFTSRVAEVVEGSTLPDWQKLYVLSCQVASVIAHSKDPVKGLRFWEGMYHHALNYFGLTPKSGLN